MNRSTQAEGSAKVLWLFGLPGAGKSTIGDAAAEILELKGIKCARLDGDVLRTGLCRDLGFSGQDRAENLRRAAHVAKYVSEIPCPVIATFISPLESDRALVRAILGSNGVLVWVKTALSECVRRDPKGMYAKASRGEIAEFTGISSPFEEPVQFDGVLDTSAASAKQLASSLLEEFLFRSR